MKHSAKNMFRIVGGTDSDAQMAAELRTDTDLSRDGAKVVVEALHKCSSNLERIAILVGHMSIGVAREILRKYDFLPSERS